MRLNNCGFFLEGDEEDKLNYVSNFKFFIAFENWSYPGYVTEKIIHPMIVNTIPIYWGFSKIGEEFNPKSFLNLHDFLNEQPLIEEIVRINTGNSEYEKRLNEP